MITPYMKFNQNLRGRVLFQDFFGRSVVERLSMKWVDEWDIKLPAFNAILLPYHVAHS